MEWEPISEDALLALIEAAEAEMDAPLLAFWQRIRGHPVKWQLPPWGDEGGGFWVVAVMGQECIWYNDIEDGFNISRFESFGRITDYWCNQAELLPCVRGYFVQFILAALPDGLAQLLEPVCQELAGAGESVREARVGPSRPAREFLDVEAVRLRIAQDQGGPPFPGQAALVEVLGNLPGEQAITYIILETAARAAKCYVDVAARRLLGVLWLPAGRE